jgi:hypothetical protein
MISNFLSEIDNHRHLHKNNKNIPEEYKTCSLHIALERADKNKDWIVFNKLYKIAPQYLKNHLYMTSIFDYNYLKLSSDKQFKLFEI